MCFVKKVVNFKNYNIKLMISIEYIISLYLINYIKIALSFNLMQDKDESRESSSPSN